MNKNIPLLISFSGGRTSAFMTKYLVDKYKNELDIHIVFANTGKEREETLEFVNECDTRWNLGVVWIEAKVIHEENVGTTFNLVDFKMASRNGEPFEDIIKKYSIPNQAFPHCTRELKLQPIRKYMQSLGHNEYTSALGIRFDEPNRLKFKKNYYYPLATEIRVDKNYIRKFWDAQCFDLKLKDYEGNCDMCWKKSERKLMTMILDNPKLIEWWNKMELKYGGKNDFTFFRNNKSAQDLIEMANGNFFKAQDKWDEQKKQQTLFEDIDFELNCLCKA
jgi:hypothetical protein